MPTPPVTWIMVVRDHEPTLDAALASIAAQDYPRHKLLVWDDGSSDGSRQVVERWFANGIRGRVLSSRRVGRAYALSALIARTKTELIAYADPTTQSRPRRITHQAACLTAHRKIGLLSCGYPGSPHRGPDDTLPLNDAEYRWALRFHNPIDARTVMLRRSAVLEVGNVRGHTPGEDYDLWVRLAMICRFAHTTKTLVEPAAAGDMHTPPPALDGEAFHRLRERLVGRLLPGTEPVAASRLLRLIDHERQPVTEDDLRRFRQAAMLAAQACRYEPSYFLKTALFQSQEAALRERYLRHEPVIRACLPLLRSAKTLVGKLKHRPPGQAA